MTQRGATRPDWAEILRNVIELEARRGYNNSSVVGGMDRFLERWQQALTFHIPAGSESRPIFCRRYAELSENQRKEWAAFWLDLIDNGVPVIAPVPDSGEPPPIDSPPDSGPEPGPGLIEDSPAPRVTASDEESFTSTRPAFRLPPAGQSIDALVDRLRGISGRMSERLKRLDVETVRDLLYLFPRRHEDYSNVVPVSEVIPGQECTVVARVWESRVIRQGPGGRRQDTEAVLGDDTGNIRAIWFGQRYLARTLQPGRVVAISGKAEVFRGQPSFESPAVEPLENGQPGIHTGRMVPVYPLTEGLTARALRGFTWDALDNWLGGVEETLTPEVAGAETTAGMMPLREAIFQAHYPDDEETWRAARTRLAFDELLTLQLAVFGRRRESQEVVQGVSVAPPGGVVENFLRSLPFDLTGAQARCIGEIAGDMKRGAPPMNRLLQGEVGSGKTVVALSGLLSAIAAGYQGALMAPTEVLAEQHFRSVSQMLEDLPRPVQEENLFSVYLEGLDRPVSVGLLTGSVRAPVKRLLTAMVSDGTLDLIIGTQALIQDGVSIPNLALAVADEQHRFGVMQRTALRERGGENPHTLIMSATPIPRTLSMTLYGDLDISTIDELPAGRQQVRTHWVPQDRRARTYGFVRGQVSEGRQAFVVCPLIEESSSIEARAATEEYERLSKEVFPDLKVGLLHGRLHSRDKDRILRSFSDGNLDILVTTAVVEVGIDVPNATIMLIEGAERFGLAQLHQFRGRVGRGEHRSYCLLLSSETQSASAKERLSALERTHDGFELAEIDLELRGAGDFFGTRQSGLPALRMAQFSDRALLESARELAGEITAVDPHLKAPGHSALAAQVSRFLSRTDSVQD